MDHSKQVMTKENRRTVVYETMQVITTVEFVEKVPGSCNPRHTQGILGVRF